MASRARWIDFLHYIYIPVIAAAGFGATAFLVGGHILIWLACPLIWFGAAVAIYWRRRRGLDALERAEELLAFDQYEGAQKALLDGIREEPGREDLMRLLLQLEAEPRSKEAGVVEEAQVLAAYGKARPKSNPSRADV